MSCWDTSALLKLYLAESNSASFRSLVRPDMPRATGFIGKPELRTVFRRREAEGVIANGGSVVFFDRLLDDIANGWLTLIPETAALCGCDVFRFYHATRCFPDTIAVNLLGAGDWSAELRGEAHDAGSDSSD